MSRGIRQLPPRSCPISFIRLSVGPSSPHPALETVSAPEAQQDCQVISWEAKGPLVVCSPVSSRSHRAGAAVPGVDASVPLVFLGLSGHCCSLNLVLVFTMAFSWLGSFSSASQTRGYLSPRSPHRTYR